MATVYTYVSSDVHTTGSWWGYVYPVQAYNTTTDVNRMVPATFTYTYVVQPVEAKRAPKAFPEVEDIHDGDEGI